jgi:hypothetical protein
MGNKQKRLDIKAFFDFKVENIGVEPITSCLPGKRSSQMS